MESSSPRCVLIADDESIFRTMSANRLRQEGIEVCSASNGEEAIRVAKEKQPRLIVLDIKMPILDGLDTCTKLKEDPQTRDAKVIFLTALASEKDHGDLARAYGAVDFIDKNLGLDEVVQRIKSNLPE